MEFALKCSDLLYCRRVSVTCNYRVELVGAQVANSLRLRIVCYRIVSTGCLLNRQNLEVMTRIFSAVFENSKFDIFTELNQFNADAATWRLPTTSSQSLLITRFLFV